MATLQVSAGVYVNTLDFSQYAPLLGACALCVVGGATKGPLNSPQVFTNIADLVAMFGPPVLNDYGLQAAIVFLGQGSNLTYIRIAHDAVQADVPIPGTGTGTPATAGAGTVTLLSSTNPSDADTVTIRNTIPVVNLNNDSVGAAGNVTITKSSTALTVTGMAGGTGSSLATGSVSFTANPTTADTVTVSDGSHSATVFEFTNGSPAGSNVAVGIGADQYATAQNFITILNGLGAGTLAVAAVQGYEQVVFEFDNNGMWTSGHFPVLIGITAAASLLNLIAAINAQGTVPVVATNITVTVPQLSVVNDQLGTVGNGLLATTGAQIAVTGFSGGTNAITGSSANVLSISALNPGSWGNDISVTITSPSAVIGAPSGNFDVSVYAPVDQTDTLQLVENFPNMSLFSASSRQIYDVLLNGIQGQLSASQYIGADVLSLSGTPNSGSYALGTGGGDVGTDGITGLVEADYIGTINGQQATGLQAAKNPDLVPFNVLSVPGNSDVNVINAMLAIATFRNDCMILVDPPFGLSVNQVIEWHNGQGNLAPNSPTQPLNFRQGALYWPWVQTTDSYNQVTLWLPPSGFAAGAWAFNDQSAGPQYAPAGPNRGGIAGIAVEYSADAADQANLAGGSNKVNPILNVAQGGLQLYGNLTLQRALTSLGSINTQRMLIYAQKLIATSVRFLVFEPNNPVTWLKFVSLVNPILENLKQNNGITLFTVQCDAITNTSQLINNKTMLGVIKIQPTPTAEVIVINFALYATGADFNLPSQVAN